MSRYSGAFAPNTKVDKVAKSLGRDITKLELRIKLLQDQLIAKREKLEQHLL